MAKKTQEQRIAASRKRMKRLNAAKRKRIGERHYQAVSNVQAAGRKQSIRLCLVK